MAKTTRMLMRRSISTFLQDFHHFTSTPALFALPFALSTLLSPPLVSSSRFFPPLHARLQALLFASGVRPSSRLFSFLTLNLSRALLSFVFLLPFSLSSLLLSKAFVIRALFPRHGTSSSSSEHDTTQKKPVFFSWITTLNRLVATQFCNVLVVFSANATCLSLLVACFNALDLSGLSYSENALAGVTMSAAVVYSVVAANAYVACHLALVVSCVSGRAGFGPILEACFLVSGRRRAALALAVSANAALAGVEAIFRCRVVRGYYYYGRVMSWPVVLEAVLIGYMYSVVLVVDAIAGCVLLEGCGRGYETIGRERDRRRSIFGKGESIEMVL
ncbi:tetratricopeptide repeat protein [Striga asiatica]|uniref:Tetratricopeptide repeat protein n=1 Tax=Striga asiatica TaxID=4170 RepID=A0A5A7Q0F4_STRAF|nr:tetratricopeptide repeat protein [Striga asiatica]